MSAGSSIQWCDDTVNPVSGCSGCELWRAGAPAEEQYCYAGTLTQWRKGNNRVFAKDFDMPELFPGRMAKAASRADLLGQAHREKFPKPWLDGARRLIFVSDMGDALSEGPYRDGGDYGTRRLKASRGRLHDGGIPFEYLATEVIEHVKSAAGLRHAWLWLTKRPRRMAEFSRWLREERGVAWPENLWAGTSITSKATLGRIREIEAVGAAVAFVSVEPLREGVSVAESLAACPSVRWAICGGESDQGEAKAHEFRIEWARSIREECSGAGVSLFVKQLGSRVTEGGVAVALGDGHGGEWDEWPEDLRVRALPAEAYCSSVGAEWTPADVADWSRVATPQTRAAVRMVADASAPVSTANANAGANAMSGGPILGGLLAWATRRGLRPPFARVPVDGRAGYAFSSRGLRRLFRERLAPE